MPYSGLPIKAAAEICSRTRLYFWGLAARGCVLDMSPFLNSGGGPPATVRRGGRWKRGHGNAPGRRLPGERAPPPRPPRSDEHTSELQSLMRISYAVFCLKKKKYKHEHPQTTSQNKIY